MLDIAHLRADTPGVNRVLHFNNAGAALPRFRGREGIRRATASSSPSTVRPAPFAVRKPSAQPSGPSVRAGLHTGECETIGDKIGGIAGHIGARVAALARPGEVLVSNTMRDLVAGSGLSFEERGTHTPGEWRLYALAAARVGPG